MVYYNKYTYNISFCQFYLDGWGKSGGGNIGDAIAFPVHPRCKRGRVERKLSVR